MIRFLKRFAKKVEQLNEVEVGIYEGDICNRHFCQGVIYREEGSCSCNTCGHPPCWYCADAPHYCDICGWESWQ